MSELTGMFLVTDGMGFIGSNFIRHILSGHAAIRVVKLDKLTHAGNPRNLADLEGDRRYAFLRGDICDETLVGQAPEAHGAEVIIHFAVESHVDRSIRQADDFIRTNVQGRRVLVDAAGQILALTGRPEALIRHVKDRLGHDRRYALDWTPTIPFAEGLRQTVEWYRTHPAWWQDILSGGYRVYYARQYGEGTHGRSG